MMIIDVNFCFRSRRTCSRHERVRKRGERVHGACRHGRRRTLLHRRNGDNCHRGGLSQPHHRRRQFHGDDLVQDRQAAADHQQLFPVLVGGGRPGHRAHLHAAVHRVHDPGLLAFRTTHL